MERAFSLNRKTKETEINVSVKIDGQGDSSINTTNAFLDHIIGSFAKHSLVDITINAESLDGIDHHRTEDIAITLGETLDEALSDRATISRFANVSVPMDDALADVSLDLIKRPFVRVSLGIRSDIEGLPREDIEHFFDSLLGSLHCCAHVTVTRGENDHHRVEAAIKALAISFRRAAEPDPRRTGSPSSKGMM